MNELAFLSSGLGIIFAPLLSAVICRLAKVPGTGQADKSIARIGLNSFARKAKIAFQKWR
jgi:hypothetical protein